MSRKLMLTFAAVALAVVTVESAAFAGVTISDRRYWPNEAHPSTPTIDTESRALPFAPAFQSESVRPTPRAAPKVPKMKRNPS